MKMKYIVISDGKQELMFTFPNEVWHSVFYDTVQSLKDNPGSNWERKYRGWACVAAGFVSIDSGAMCGVFCHGTSESLGIGSRGIIDANLYATYEGHLK